MSRVIWFLSFLIILISFASSIALLKTDLRKIAETEKIFLRENAFYQKRTYPFKQIPKGARELALKKLTEDFSLQPLAALEVRKWQAIGPSAVFNGQPLDPQNSPPINISGRATAIIVAPNDSNRIFLGTAQGGLWLTRDSGKSWQPLTDNLPSLAIGALAMDPKNPNIILLGTGEANFSGDSYYGAGVFKSTDSGETWAQLGDLPTRARISRIIFDPNNSQIIYLTTTSASSNQLRDLGVFKSIDGGASWTKILDGMATDINIDTRNSNNLLAALGDPNGASLNGLYQTNNGGNSWQLISSLPNGTNIGRIAIARSLASSNEIFISFSNANTGTLLNVYKSVDGGESWKIIRTPDYCRPQCFYNNFIAVHPKDPKLVYLGGVPLLRSTDGGETYSNISISQDSGPGLHADQHDIAFDPNDSDTIYVANDGGIARSRDLGDHWRPLNEGLATLQFQSVAPHPTNKDLAIGGTQDNGTLLFTGKSEWLNIDSGDGGQTAIDPNQPKTFYHFFFQLLFARSDDSGEKFVIKIAGLPVNSSGETLERTLFYAPLALDQNQSTTLYTGAIRLYRTTNRGETWSAISSDLTRGSGAISAIAIAPSNSQTLYVGSSDANVMRTTDSGTTWQVITNGLPNRFVSAFAINDKNPQVAYVSFSGFGSGHIFKTENGGTTWTNISNNLPDIPINSIALDPAISGRIYLASDIGVFISSNDGKSWQALNTGLPNVAVFDLKLNRQTGVILAATHGRGVYSLALDGEDDQISPKVTVVEPRGGESFNSGDMVSIRWQANDDVEVTLQEINLSTDSGATFSLQVARALSGQSRSFNWVVPEISTTRARLQITSKDGAGNIGKSATLRDFTIIAPLRPLIDTAQFKVEVGKLIISGNNFFTNDSVIEINGQMLITKYPKKFQLPNGTLSRLQSKDNLLKQLLVPGKKVVITIFNKTTGLRSKAVDFIP
ncbi:MAG: hypothetical protein HY819_06740 [Acidobacteria bacterium]|nr:hypothetical protein [Acidobacteriota bacterium]